MFSKRSTLVVRRRKLIRPLPVFLAALAVWAVAASPAAATFGEPFDLSDAGDEPQVAVDADGDAVFAWTAGRVQARARSAAGVLSPIQTLSGSRCGSSSPQVAVDADGDAVFVWSRCGRIEARARSAAGILSPVQVLDEPVGCSPCVAFPEVAVDADGDAVFTWVRWDGSNWRVQTRARSAAGALSAARNLSRAGQDAFAPGSLGPRPQVAIDGEGDAVFAWARFDGTNWRAQTRARSAAGALSAVQTLSDPGGSANHVGVGVDADGNAVFTWSESDGAERLIQARARSAAGALSGIETLSATSLPAQAQPQVAVDADGDAVFTWTHRVGDEELIQTRARTAAGALSAIQNLSAAGQGAHSPQVAVDPGGDAVFTWERTDHIDSVTLVGITVIQARARTAAGALSAVQTLSDAEHRATGSEIAVDPDGDAVAVWARDGGAAYRIEGAIGP